MKTPTAFFPVSAETLPLVKYIEEFSDQYYITTLLTLPGYGLSGKDAGYADNRGHIGMIINSDLQDTKDMWSTLLVANHSDRIGGDNVNNHTVDAIKTALILDKTVICAARLKPDDLQEIMILSHQNACQFIYLPDRGKLQIPKDIGRLYCQIAPVIFVGGLIDEANTLEVFMSIGGRLQRSKLKVASISTDINCSLAGIPTFTQLTYSEGINEVQKVYALNNLVEKIEKDVHPDLFIVHLPGPIMEYNEIIPNGFGLFTCIVSKALSPDFFVCCIPCEFANSKFINAVSKGLVGNYGFQIDYVHISNAIVDGYAVLQKQYIDVVYTTQEYVDDKVIQLRSSSEVPIYNLLNCNDLELLYEDIKKQISENQSTKMIL